MDKETKIETEELVEQIPLSKALIKTFGWEETFDKHNEPGYVKDDVWLYYTPGLEKNGFQVILKGDNQNEIEDLGPFFIYSVEDLFDHYEQTTGNPLILPVN